MMESGLNETSISSVWEGDKDMGDNTLKLGDIVDSADGFFFNGEIVEISDDIYYVMFNTGSGGGTLPFEESELLKINKEIKYEN